MLIKNPTSLKQSTLKIWNDQQIIEWLGWVKDVKKILLGIDILCLPSLEGLPKSLEGASLSFTLITTNTVGCRK